MKLLLSFAVLIFLCGCQHSAYNACEYWSDGSLRSETHVGTIEFLVIDSKSGMSVKLADGTKLGLAKTTTEPDEDVLKVLIDQWLLLR